METLTNYLAVAAGGSAGAVLRYYLGGSVLSRTAAPFPTATFVINVTGSFIIGFFLTLVTERVPVNPHVRLAVAVGFVGAYTTFSTFEYETARLVESREYLYAFLNVVLSFAVGFAAVWAGIVAARKVEGLPVTSHAAYDRFEERADASDPAQSEGAERDIRDSSIRAAGEKKGEASTRKRAWASMAEGLVPAMKLTVAVGGDETHERRPLHREVLRILRECGVAGATLTKGVMSFGVGRRIHSDMDEMMMGNLPIIIEAVDERDRLESAADRIAQMLSEHGLVQLQPTWVARRVQGAEERREG